MILSMSTTESKPKRQPLVIHFRADDRKRLRAIAEKKDRSMSNMAAEFIREGMARAEQNIQPS